ncbi:ATP-binding protein [Kitasatospora sp. NPDC049285]|uniref:ATP-binding protein n=1 Tax=Kitasatospora sp. NPDC049285 TaxID=3157096 RepID=UPI0034208D84
METSRDTLGTDPVTAGPVLPPGGQRRRLHMAALAKPVARARAFTETALADWSWPTPRDRQDIVLVVAELVGNAKLHADGPVDLILDASPDRLRIEVSDTCTDLPVPRSPRNPALPGGHGLFIVQQAVSRWGAQAHGAGKTVWAEFDTPGA